MANKNIIKKRMTIKELKKVLGVKTLIKENKENDNQITEVTTIGEIRKRINEMRGFNMLGGEFKAPEETKEADLAECDETNECDDKEEYSYHKKGDTMLGDGFAPIEMNENQLIDFMENMVNDLREEYTNLKFVDKISKKYNLREDATNVIKQIIWSDKNTTKGKTLFEFVDTKFEGDIKYEMYDDLAEMMDYGESEEFINSSNSDMSNGTDLDDLLGSEEEFYIDEDVLGFDPSEYEIDPEVELGIGDDIGDDEADDIDYNYDELIAGDDMDYSRLNIEEMLDEKFLEAGF